MKVKGTNIQIKKNEATYKVFYYNNSINGASIIEIGLVD